MRVWLWEMGMGKGQWFKGCVSEWATRELTAFGNRRGRGEEKENEGQLYLQLRGLEGSSEPLTERA